MTFVFIYTIVFYNLCMQKKKTEILFDFADTNDGYVSVAEAREIGLAQTYLSLAEAEGLFHKVSKGLYLKKGYERDPYYELFFQYHKAVFSFYSALYLHGISEEPRIEVNLPLNYLTKGIEGVVSRHAGAKEYGLGQSLVITPRGNMVNSYDLERTLVDLIRHHGDFDKDTFVALWLKGKEKTPYWDKLRAYAEAFHVDGELSLLLQLY